LLPILGTPVPGLFSADDLDELNLRKWEYLTQSAGKFDLAATHYNDYVEVLEKADRWFFLWKKENRIRSVALVDEAYFFALTNLYLTSEAEARGALLHSEAGVWLNRPVSRRWPPEAVQKTVSELAQVRNRLMQFADQFDKFNSPLSQRNEKLRIAYQSLVKEWADLFANVENYLDQEEPTNPLPGSKEPQDTPVNEIKKVSEQALNQQIKRINGMRLEIVKLSTEKNSF
jgi:hypothetical protein